MRYACTLLEDNVYLLWGSFVCVVTLASSSVIFIFSEKRKKEFLLTHYILLDPSAWLFACLVFFHAFVVICCFSPSKLTFSKRNTIIRVSNGLDQDQDQCSFFVWFDFLCPINNLSVIKRGVFLGWTSTKQGLMFLLEDTKQWCRQGSNPLPFGLKASTLPLHSQGPKFWWSVQISGANPGFLERGFRCIGVGVYFAEFI